ncbi:hypothetical protein K2Q02_01490 [Patescibacteria group bacterium]|nr:hypothetical protein [Patescibacteria group bacterium]
MKYFNLLVCVVLLAIASVGVPKRASKETQRTEIVVGKMGFIASAIVTATVPKILLKDSIVQMRILVFTSYSIQRHVQPNHENKLGRKPPRQSHPDPGGFILLKLYLHPKRHLYARDLGGYTSGTLLREV